MVFIEYVRANLVVTGNTCKIIHDPWKPSITTNNELTAVPRIKTPDWLQIF